MKRALQCTALALAAGSLVWWLAAGANRGWTKTTVPVKTVDEITGIEAITYEKRFMPGVDFVAAVWFGAALAGGASLFFRRKTNQQPQP